MTKPPDAGFLLIEPIWVLKPALADSHGGQSLEGCVFPVPTTSIIQLGQPRRNFATPAHGVNPVINFSSQKASFCMQSTTKEEGCKVLCASTPVAKIASHADINQTIFPSSSGMYMSILDFEGPGQPLPWQLLIDYLYYKSRQPSKLRNPHFKHPVIRKLSLLLRSVPPNASLTTQNSRTHHFALRIRLQT